MSPELLAAIERARHHKMTPQEIFEQRVSFVYGQCTGSGVTKDDVRKQIVEEQGYPAEASERAAIVAWLRSQAAHVQECADGTDDSDTRVYYNGGALFTADAADAIERGDHLA